MERRGKGGKEEGNKWRKMRREVEREAGGGGGR